MSLTVHGKLFSKSTGISNVKIAEEVNCRMISDVIEGVWVPGRARKRAFGEPRDTTPFTHLTGFYVGEELSHVTPSHIADYNSVRSRQGAKRATLAREFEVLRHAFNLVVRKWGWLKASSFEKVKIDKVGSKKERWITRDEEVRLLAASLPWLKEVIVFALNTGLRQDEGLRRHCSTSVWNRERLRSSNWLDSTNNLNRVEMDFKFTAKGTGRETMMKSHIGDAIISTSNQESIKEA